METQTVTDVDAESNSVEQDQIAHLAGYFDATGNIRIMIEKSDSYRLGYSIRPQLRLQRPGKDDPVFGKTIAFSEDVGAKFSISEISSERREQDSVRWTVEDVDSIERVLKEMMPYLVTKHRKAVLMLEYVIPAIRNDEHLTKEGFYELVKIAEQLRERSVGHGNVKYTPEFFADKWSLSE
jgi:hypothetical protein